MHIKTCKVGMKVSPNISLNVCLSYGGKISDSIYSSQEEIAYGKIVHIDTSTVRVQWAVRNKLNNLITPRKEYNHLASEIKKYELDQKKIKECEGFQPGMKIDDYVEILKKKPNMDKQQKKMVKIFDNCVLAEDIKEKIEEALVIVLRAEMFEKWGINENFEKGIGNTILLHGPPGVGKTMVSESIAAILGCNLMRVGNDQIQSHLPGQTEKNIMRVFETAKEQNAVVLLDECDSMLSDREMVGVILGAEINAILTEIERFKGVCILTTNRLKQLDPALQRRILVKIKVDEPDQNARKKIWQKLIPEKCPTKELDYEELSKHKLTGGDIKNCILIAARRAIARNKNYIHMDIFNEAIKEVIESKNEYNSELQKRYKNTIRSDIDTNIGQVLKKEETIDKVKELKEFPQ